MKPKGYCRLCDHRILKGQITKRMKTDVPHEDFIIVHKECVQGCLLNRAGDETARQTLMNTPDAAAWKKHRLSQKGISHRRPKGHH